MKELFLFVRPPRPLWPFNGPFSAFWPPLAFASLAAMLRQQLPDLRVEILDAPALQMGWRTLQTEIRRRQPTYVGIGEEAVSCVEGLRLAALAHDHSAKVVAGGCFFGNVAPEILRTGLVDVVVHGEGEITLCETVAALRDGSIAQLHRVAGISFRDQETVFQTSPRTLIANLDDLPMPAYDLLPVEQYGARSRNHPHLAALELGRGCVGTCDFCVLWRQMGRITNGTMTPHLRVKSPERLLEEVRLMIKRHGRRYIGWVDPTFNAHPKVPAQLGELLLRHNLRVGQSAWMRTDALVRDAASGALHASIKAGLNEVYLGIERPDATGLEDLGKNSNLTHARASMNVLNQNFPDVMTVGSFIYGLPGDTPATMKAIHALAIELQLDQFFFIPFTPLPGTKGWRPELWDPTGLKFREFGFLALPLSARQGELEYAMIRSLLFHWPWQRLKSYAHRLLLSEPRKRRVSWRLLGHSARFHWHHIMANFVGTPDNFGLIFPHWYET